MDKRDGYNLNAQCKPRFQGLTLFSLGVLGALKSWGREGALCSYLGIYLC